MSVQFLFRRGTALEWSNANPTLGNGEPGFETNTNKFKIGDGTTNWNSLPYITDTVTDLNTTYSVSTENTTNGVTIKLTGSDASTDSVSLLQGNNITLSQTNDAITISSTASGGSATISELSDVSLTGLSIGEILKWNGSAWVNDTDNTGTGAGLSSRSTAQTTTGNIANNATANVSITGFKTYVLLKITTSHASWVRLYTDVASRTADSSRLQGSDPLPGSGVIAEVISSGNETILISPGTIGFNNESPITTSIPVSVTNLSGSSVDISITLTLLQLEA